MIALEGSITEQYIEAAAVSNCQGRFPGAGDFTVLPKPISSAMMQPFAFLSTRPVVHRKRN